MAVGASRAGGKKFDEAACLATRNDPILHAAIRALLESLASIEGQQARLDDELDELAKRNEIAWRLMSVPGVGRITALAYMAAIERTSGGFAGHRATKRLASMSSSNGWRRATATGLYSLSTSAALAELNASGPHSGRGARREPISVG